MQRNTALKIVNPALGLLVLNQVATGLVGDLLPRQAFEALHEGGGIALALAAVLHLALNWNWVKANFLKRSPVTGP
jgi:hypothetical protein